MRFCAICGKLESKDEPLIDNLCWNCYREKHKLIIIPKNIEVHVCSSCGSYRLGGKWIQSKRFDKPEFEAAIEAVKKYVKLTGNGVIRVLPEGFLGKGRIKLKIIAFGTVHPLIPNYEEKASIIVKVRKTTCPTCIKIASKHYVATIQIRAEGRKLTRNEITLVNRIIENTVYREIEHDRSAYVVEVEELSEGINFKFASTRIARLIASKIKNEVGAQIKETFKLIGINRSTGKRISRLTISVRFPPFTFNDIVKFNDHLIRFEGFKSGKFIGIDLSSWSKFSINYKDVWSNKVEKIASLNELP
ncbi:MAG: hypothetical protein DRJ21_00730, partial [Candidatus Methanomethylicota archaeon]